MEFKGVFLGVPDFRLNHAFKKYLLCDILTLSLCAIFSGAETDEEIETYGKERLAFFKDLFICS